MKSKNYPHKIKKQNKTGFTLAELLIVVAIISVLVLIAIPVFNNSLKKSREATCLSNRRSLLSVVATAYITDNSAQNIQNAFNTELSTGKYVCPEGGTLTCQLSDQDHFSIQCSEHGDEMNNSLSSPNMGAVLESFYAQMQKQNSSLKLPNNETVDSSSPTGKKTEAMNNLLKEAGYNDAPAWSIAASSTGQLKYIWTTQDITSIKPNQNISVPVICYNASDKTYSVGFSQVVTRSLDNKTYNVVTKNYNSVNTTSDNLSYEDALKAYNQLLKQ